MGVGLLYTHCINLKKTVSIINVRVLLRSALNRKINTDRHGALNIWRALGEKPRNGMVKRELNREAE